ncbi:cation-translocating P-type ATPase [Clostridium sp. ZS2-4]|uniref:cation-translocating P-type ATPase n=1 Tax=Clostridium sp. ZS2-4 TaxID=2987703 RepID=UPI00227BE9B4|nr:HAD-IC family P-type ATPase [Clostridium sp. ZS2-4]MCY6354838.1 HAD-IC family P-type ATPase [Clostridium sp. ZS2-4]
MIDWYNYSWNDVVRELQSDVNKGLSKKNAEENREKYGGNNTLNLEIKSGAFLFVKQIVNIYAIIGLGICFLLFLNREAFLASILASIIFLCIILHTVKDYNNEKSLKELEKIIPKEALVKREGKVQKIDCEELVIGDIVYLERGDIVPADLRLISCEGLNIKESALTGDNSIIEKYSTKIEDKEISLSEMKNMAFKSSFVIEGIAVAIVTAIGENTQIGKITKGLIKGKHERNVLEENVSRIINILTGVFCSLSFFILIYNFYRKTNVKDIDSLISSLYLIIVPLHIIFVIGIISLVVKKKMKNHGVQFKGLSSIQRLSNTNIIFVDKVGTLTEDKMCVSKLYTNGRILEDNYEQNEENKDNVDRILNIGLVCNDVKRDIDGQDLKGDLTEVSLANYGFKKSVDKRIIDKEQQRVLQIPYDRDKRIKTTVNKIEDKYRANVKGTVDKLIERCTHIMKNGIEVEITDKDINEIRNADLIMSKESLYVEGFAYRNFNYEPSINENIESNLVFVGLVGFENPIKEDAIKYLNYCKSLAIKPTLITEDNKITAEAFGRKIGILNKNDIVLSGVELDHMEEKEFEKYVERVSIYSKISSKNKWKISSVFKKLGYNLTVTGNKFTDSPSFRIAHVGVAAGKKCTNITKKLGDIYIEDNDFMKLLSLIEESRKLMKVLKDEVRFALTVAMGEFISLVLPVILGYKPAINPIKLIFMNFITVILSSIYIYSQHYNITINNYERESLDKTVFRSLTSSMIMFGSLTGVLTTLALTFGNKNNLLLGSANAFIILNLSPIIFSHYFLEVKKCFKNKLTILLFIINLIISMFLLSINFNKKIVLSIVNNSSNLRMIIIIMVIQIASVIFMKEIDRN